MIWKNKFYQIETWFKEAAMLPKYLSDLLLRNQDWKDRKNKSFTTIDEGRKLSSTVLREGIDLPILIGENRPFNREIMKLRWLGLMTPLIIENKLWRLLLVIILKHVIGWRYEALLLFVLTAALGGMFLCGDNDLTTIFGSSRMFSLCSYLLSEYIKKDVWSNEVTLKYLLMGGASW